MEAVDPFDPVPLSEVTLDPEPAAPPAAAPAPVPAPEAPPEPIGLPEVATALVGLLAFGATTVIGTGGVGVAHTTPALAVGAVGALVLTGPAIVVGHQYLRVATPASSVVEQLARGLVAGGRLAWGVVPAALFFAATAPGSWPLVLGAFGAGVGAALLGAAVTGLSRLAPGHAAWHSAIGLWACVCTVIALRLVATLLIGG
jgi:hypothetical protein